MQETTRLLLTAALSSLVTLLITILAFQAAYIPAAMGEWIWCVPFRTEQSVATHVLFAFRIAAALFGLLAGLLGPGASLMILSMDFGAHVIGAVVAIVIGTLAAAGWYAAVTDISRKLFVWYQPHFE